MSDTDHVIEHTDDGDRIYWECSCGRSGSCSSEADWEIRAEKHIPRGDRFVYRSRMNR